MYSILAAIHAAVASLANMQKKGSQQGVWLSISQILKEQMIGHQANLSEV